MLYGYRPQPRQHSPSTRQDAERNRTIKTTVDLTTEVITLVRIDDLLNMSSEIAAYQAEIKEYKLQVSRSRME
jgi:hypothetical protein